MADFVARGEAGTLSDEQIRDFSHNWSRDDWWEFYYQLSIAKGFENPRQWADRLIADDNSGGYLRYYGHVIPRAQHYHSSMRQPHYWFASTDACDENEPDTDYEFHFHVSASNVLNMAWYTTDYWIGLLIGSYDGLKAYGSSAFTRICVGDTRICWVNSADDCRAGADQVKNVLRLKP